MAKEAKIYYHQYFLTSQLEPAGLRIFLLKNREYM